MLEEFLGKIEEMAKRSMAGIVTAPTCEPKGTYFVRDGEGNLSRKQAEAWPFGGEVGDVASLVEAANQMSGPHVFWYGRDGYCLVGDNGREVVRLPTRLSLQAKWVGDCGAQSYSYSQKDLLPILKNLLYGCGGELYADLIRAVKFRVLQEGHAEVRQGKASIGKSIEAQMAGTAEIPEYVTFHIPAFANILWAKTYKVEFTLEVDAQAERFILKPLPNTFERLMLQAEDDLLAHLRLAIETSDDGELADGSVLLGKPKLEG